MSRNLQQCFRISILNKIIYTMCNVIDNQQGLWMMMIFVTWKLFDSKCITECHLWIDIGEIRITNDISQIRKKLSRSVIISWESANIVISNIHQFTLLMILLSILFCIWIKIITQHLFSYYRNRYLRSTTICWDVKCLVKLTETSTHK